MAKPSNIFKGRGLLKNLLLRCIILVALIGLQPFLWQWVKAAADEVRQKRSEQQHVGDVQRRVEEIEQIKQSQRELLAQLQVIVPDEEKLLPVIERLQLMARQDQRTIILSLQAIEREVPHEAAPPTQAIPFRIGITATGTISHLLTYLHQVEHLPELTVVEQIVLTPASGAVLQPLTSPTPTPQGTPVPTASATPPRIEEPVYTMTLSVLFYFQEPESDATNQ